MKRVFRFFLFWVGGGGTEFYPASFPPCHNVANDREKLKILIPCQDPGLRELTVAIFPNARARCMRDSRDRVLMLKRLAYRTGSSALVAALYKGLVRHCLEYGDAVWDSCLQRNPFYERSNLTLGGSFGRTAELFRTLLC